MENGRFDTYVSTAGIQKTLMGVEGVPTATKQAVIGHLKLADVFKSDHIRLLYLGAVMGALYNTFGKDIMRLMESLYEPGQS